MLLAGLAVIAIGVAVFCKDDNVQETAPKSRREKIAERKDGPPRSPKVATSDAIRQPTNELSEAWQKYYDGRDTNQWIVVKDPRTGKERLSRLLKPGPKNRKPPLYKAHALNALHAILFKDFSSPLPGIRIDDRFVQSFQDALVEKIEILDTDSESDRQAKQDMIATMDFLKQEIKNGGDLKEIVGDDFFLNR